MRPRSNSWDSWEDSWVIEKDKDEEEKEDRISKLPDELIHHILSFCNMKFAVKTSILSKRWRYIWTSLPTLSFDSSTFKDRPFYSPELRKYIEPIMFEDFVDNILLNHKSDINKFGLKWSLEADNDYGERNIINNHLNTWITAALDRNVVELSVYIRAMFYNQSDSEIIRHQFLSNLFSCGTLTKLKLIEDINIWYEEADLPSKGYLSKITFPKSINLHCLKVLELESLHIVNANNLFLTSNCPPLLEYLSIKDCKLSVDNSSDTDWFSIMSPTLKYLKLKNCYMPKKRIKLNVPNLQNFVCEDYQWREFSMVNISSLVCAHIEMQDFRSGADEEYYYTKVPEHGKKLCATRVMDFLISLYTVKELQLSPGILEIISGTPDLLDSLPAFQLGSVRSLKLVTFNVRTCFQAIHYLMKVLPSIESLTVEILNEHSPNFRHYDHRREDLKVTFSIPCVLSQLKSVKIKGLGGFDSEFNLVEFLLKNAPNLEEVVLYKMYGNKNDLYKRIEKFSSRLLSCPRSSSNIAVFLL